MRNGEVNAVADEAAAEGCPDAVHREIVVEAEVTDNTLQVITEAGAVAIGQDIGAITP